MSARVTTTLRTRRVKRNPRRPGPARTAARDCLDIRMELLRYSHLLEGAVVVLNNTIVDQPIMPEDPVQRQYVEQDISAVLVVQEVLTAVSAGLAAYEGDIRLARQNAEAASGGGGAA